MNDAASHQAESQSHGNAARYVTALCATPEGGEIKVSLRQESGHIIITIADTGPGIPAQFLDKAKDRFFRVDESRNTPGTGLGLSLANAVAGLHHGTQINVQRQKILSGPNPGGMAGEVLPFLPLKSDPLPHLSEYGGYDLCSQRISYASRTVNPHKNRPLFDSRLRDPLIQ